MLYAPVGSFLCVSFMELAYILIGPPVRSTNTLLRGARTLRLGDFSKFDVLNIQPALQVVSAVAIEITPCVQVTDLSFRVCALRTAPARV